MTKRPAKQKLKKFQRLPTHHIDTSVILEPEKTDDGRYCKKYLNLVGYKYRGFLSFPVLGELMYKILKLDDTGKRYDALDLIYSLIKTKKIRFRSITGTEKIVQKIKEIDESITPMDRQILACAIVHKVKTLVTLDKRLISNKNIEKEFKIQIKHPKELI